MSRSKRKITASMAGPSGSHEVRYEDAEHYAVTKAFLQNRSAMLQRIFAEVGSELRGARRTYE